MNRRTLLRTAGIVATSLGAAGCASPGEGGDDAADDSGDSPDADADSDADSDDAEISAVVVRNAPENPGPYEDPSGQLTATESDAIALDGITFQRAGEKGLVVAGDATNTADGPLDDVAVEVTLYDENEAEDEIFDSASVETEHGRLDAGETWQWAATFDEQPEFEIDYYAVHVTATRA